MPDFLGGYVMEPESTFPFAEAYGYNCRNWPSTTPRSYVRSCLNRINSSDGRKFSRACLVGVVRKGGDPVVFLPCHLDASMDPKYLVPENEKDKAYLEKWLQAFIEKCSPEDIEAFRQKTRFGTVRVPLGCYRLSEPAI
ncbi:hypothetical protein K435DRAFT_779845 [Dendrothele bispora CBS 962.96]|uniref:Uncharacterized protein n=1 Tax=Dendrothele bispora (strain CBS 962.96) TaxID=1314807 RepID=A0A4S8LV31_DENBC|nr:hypothetical protein K435DRAFT_779845 [Dendrothele bispora CBS 962.96]